MLCPWNDFLCSHVGSCWISHYTGKSFLSYPQSHFQIFWKNLFVSFWVYNFLLLLGLLSEDWFDLSYFQTIREFTIYKWVVHDESYMLLIRVYHWCWEKFIKFFFNFWGITIHFDIYCFRIVLYWHRYAFCIESVTGCNFFSFHYIV